MVEDRPRCTECDDAGQGYIAHLLYSNPQPSINGSMQVRQTWECTNGHTFEALVLYGQQPLQPGYRRMLTGHVRPITDPLAPGFDQELAQEYLESKRDTHE